MGTIKGRILWGAKVLASLVVGALAACMGVPVFGAVLTVERPAVMWDKVDQRLAAATPASQMLFRQFKSWCMQHLKGKELQLIDLTNVTAFVNPLDGAFRVYAIYAKKQATATRAYLGVFDDVANDATAVNERLALGLVEASKEAVVFYPDGLPLTAGLVVASYTASAGSNGTTASTSGDGANGFMLVG